MTGYVPEVCHSTLNISSRQYQINKLDMRKILSSWWLQYGILMLRFKIELSLFPLPPRLITNRLLIRYWYWIYHCDNEREISNQMAFSTWNEICTWLYIYGMASKQSRMCVHVWRPWKIHTNFLLQTCNCYIEEHAHCLLQPHSVTLKNLTLRYFLLKAPNIIIFP